MKEKLIKRMKRTERGYNIHRSAHITFNSSKAILIFILISAGISAFISYSMNGPYLNASAGGHFLLFIIPMGLLAALSRVILNLVRVIVQLLTLPSYLRHRKCVKELFGDETYIRGFGDFTEAEIGLSYFIKCEKMDVYNINFLE